jgi:hypothetical protein
MCKSNHSVLVVATFCALLIASDVLLAAEKIAIPKGYEKWERSKARVITDKKSLFYGIHYLYVDSKAMKIYKSGGVYPEGSRFMAVNYSIRDDGGKPVEGNKNMVVLMQKDKTRKETGGWLFAGFTPEGASAGLDPVKICYDCHLRDAKATDLVISRYADFK